MRLKTVIIITSLHVQLSWACSCVGLGELTKSEIDSSRAIFVGQAMKVDEDYFNYERRIIFRVVENLKGTSNGQLIYVTTNKDSGMCGVKVLEGETWYIFSSYIDPKDQTYGISICDRSTRISKQKYKRISYQELTRLMRSNQRKEIQRYKRERQFIQRYCR